MTRGAGKDMQEHLATWIGLNDFLRGASEEDCAELMRLERAGRCRAAILKRIYHRHNKMRSLRERAELAEARPERRER